MLCSQCSEVVKPIVAFDIDGTLGDYHGLFIKFAEAYLGREPQPVHYRGLGDFKFWFEIAFDTDVATFRQVKLAYRQGGMKRSMIPYNGMPELVRLMDSLGVEVWITTTRPYLRLDGVDPDTREWLRRHDIPYHGLLYDEDKYERLAENVDKRRVIAIVDDLKEQYDAAENVFGADVPILRSNPYNDGVNRANMIGDPEEMVNELLLRLHDWQDSNLRQAGAHAARSTR